jgi:signal transduction histidine kinase
MLLRRTTYVDRLQVGALRRYSWPPGSAPPVSTRCSNLTFFALPSIFPVGPLHIAVFDFEKAPVDKSKGTDMATNSGIDQTRAPSRRDRLLAASPPEASPTADIIAALRKLAELGGLRDEEYAWLANHCAERVGKEGAIIFTENEPCHHLHFILRGEVHVHRRNSGAVALYMGRTGHMTGKLPYSRMKTWGGDGYASGSLWILDLHEDIFPAMLLAIPSMAQRCVSALLDRVREFTRADEQAAKLIALGKLAANLAHELNNPASAARRAATALSSISSKEDDAKYQLGYLCRSKADLELCRDWIRQAWNHVNGEKVARKDAAQLAVNSREDELLRWLEAHGIQDAWSVAPVLAEAALPIERLDRLAGSVSPDVLALTIANFAAALQRTRTASTIVDSTSRIFDLIAAIKDYSYMDQALIQDVDLASSLDNTLAMLQSRLEQVSIERDYAPDVPAIRAFASELKQVWMALIENALDAMGDRGTLRLSIKLKGQMAFVEVWDNGPGIDPALISRIFEPFFTTKPIGHGLGLGLDMVQRIVSKHFGSVSVESKPSATCFQVRLPLEQMQIY